MKFKHHTIIIAVSLYSCHVTAEALQILYSSSSNYGPIWVYEAGKERCLSFLPPQNNDTQSRVYKDRPEIIVDDYCKMILSALYLNKNPKKILMIGLGGAVVANAMQKLVPTSDIDIVEINANILQIAKKFFFFNPNRNVKVFIEDGYNFITHSIPNKYDLIIIDAFNKHYVPPSFLTLNFVEGIKKTLKQGGVVAVNTYNDGKLKKYNDYNKLESDLYKAVFSDFHRVVSGPTTIFLAKKSSFLQSKDKIKQESQYWDSRFKPLGINSKWLAGKFKN